MNSRQFRRRCAIAGAAATIAITTVVAPAQGSAAAPSGGTADRPCFMVQAHWNTGYDGPQPTCPTPTWQMAGPADGGATMPDTRVPDFMP